MSVNFAEYEGIPLDEAETRKIPLFQRKMRSRLGCVLCLLTLCTCILAETMFIVPPILLLVWLGVLGVKPVQLFFDWYSGFFYNVAIILFESLLGIRTRSFGFTGKFKPRSVFLMNHVSHLDWLFFWSVINRQGDLSTWKVVTKDMMKTAPFFGPAMQLQNHIFITRKWELDKSEFQEKLNYMNMLDRRVQLLLFPEGGDFTERSKARSDEYADEHHLPRYEYCLHPRTTGLKYVVNALRERGLDAIYDVTIGYPDVLTKTEVEFFRGYLPREVHFYTREYKIQDLPSGDEELAEWCHERWREKEDRLRDFYANREFQDEEGGAAARSKPPEVVAQGRLPVLQVMFCYVIIPLVCLYLFCTSWFWVLHAAVCSSFLVYHSYFTDGMDYLMIRLAKRATERARENKTS